MVVVASFCALSAGASFSSVPASAAVAHNFLYSFGSLGNLGGSFGPIGGLAVDESTGDVYVLDVESQSMDKFNSLGEPAEFSGMGTDSISVPGARFGSHGQSQLAVDNSSGPAKGDIYAATGFEEIRIYGRDGVFLGDLRGPHFSVGVAVDANGAVYNDDFVNRGGSIEKYVPSANPVTSSDYVSSLPVSEPAQVAADTEGNVYVRYLGGGGGNTSGAMLKYDAQQFGAQTANGTQVALEVWSMAVDPSNNHVVVVQGDVPQLEQTGGTQLAEFDGLATPIGGPFGKGHVSRSYTVAVDGAHQRIYSVDGETGEVVVFTGPLTQPDIAVGAPSSVTETSVRLNATLNPLGIDANCEVEYGLDTSYGSTAACSPADVGSGASPVAVTADLTGLPSGTVYHYRFAATNANGTEFGTDQTFATLHVPVIDGQRVLGVSDNRATVEALVNPKHAQTGFHFEYGLDTSYGASAPVPDATIGPFDTDRAVVWTLSGLHPGSTYHYRIVATNSTGTTTGPDQVFKTYPAVTSSADECPNADIRQAQFSAYLPDCRAYEMVSPPEKEGANISTMPRVTQSSSDGSAIKYLAPTGFGDAQGSEDPGAEYVSRRGVDGWSTRAINPPQRSLPLTLFISPRYAAFSSDLSKGVFWAQSPVVTGHPLVEDTTNLYLRTDVLDGGSGNYELLTDSIGRVPQRPTTSTNYGVAFAAASADFTHILFESSNNLTAEAESLSPAQPKVYEWHNGTVKLAGILPNGTPAANSIAGNGAGGGPYLGVYDSDAKQTQRTMSSDGSRVIFEASISEYSSGLYGGLYQGGLFMRIAGSETIQLNASERATPDPGGEKPATFWTATADDSKVVFSTAEALTDDAPADSKSKLYVYDVNAPSGKHLTLISVDNEPADDSQTGDTGFGSVGISDDGSYVYFMNHNDMLVAGQRTFENSLDLLYVWHNGTVRLIGQNNNNPSLGNISSGKESAFRMTPDGRRAIFVDSLQSTAESAGVAGQFNEHAQVYVYDYETGRIACASCNPTGAPSTSNASFEDESDQVLENKAKTYLSHPLSEDGRLVFFDSSDALLPQDTNGRRDVYEYDTITGSLHMISSGGCNCDSYFVDASPDGSNVFITSRQRFVQIDFDNAADIYDVRIDGGLAAQNRPAPVGCEGDDCQGPAKAGLPSSLPSSSTFVGPGNVVPPKAAVKPKSKSAATARKLAAALKACAKKPKRKRATCKAGAKRKFKAKKSTKRSARRVGR